ncbi:unnamed protein product [Allacma fusca]|uniref:RNA-directed DNA polymerase n=1 Tax=Allacma fusca TaxID=39272 RepID=A0A8J2NJC0_9HEXA|nr:unnamed protein product [Allacma fusca]
MLAHFHTGNSTIVSSDSSSYGLGAVLRQLGDDGNLHPVAYASRTLYKAERGYAQIEKEALAMVWACERCEYFILGLPFKVETDHKPLLAIMNTKNLDELSSQLQRFRMRMMRYSYDIVHTPGKDLVAADTLYRNPLPETGDTNVEDDGEAQVALIINHIPASDKRLQEIFEAQQDDKVCKQLCKFCKTEWPSKEKLPPELKPYLQCKDELSVTDGLLMRGIRLVIPPKLMPEMLQRIHTGHLGITKCRSRAKESVWWPRISAEIQEIAERCTICIKFRRKAHEPFIPSEFPTRSWEKVAMDMFYLEGETYLLLQITIPVIRK